MCPERGPEEVQQLVLELELEEEVIVAVEEVAMAPARSRMGSPPLLPLQEWWKERRRRRMRS